MHHFICRANDSGTLTTKHSLKHTNILSKEETFILLFNFIMTDEHFLFCFFPVEGRVNQHIYEV